MRLIDADALKKKYLKFCHIYGFNPNCKFIDNAPTVKPDKELKEKIETYKNAYIIMSYAFENEVRKNQRPQGVWKFVKHGYYECSECEHLSYEIKSNFCPNCGADMRGGAEMKI